MDELIDALALTSWHDDWTGLTVAVDGLDAARFSAVDTLVELGAQVAVVAQDADPELVRLVEVVGASLVPEAPASVDLVIATGPTPAWAGDAPVWGDVELAWRVRDKVATPPWLVVAGPATADGHGALTTRAVDVLVHVLVSAGRRVIATGEGLPSPLDAVRDPAGLDAIVVQLDPDRLARLGPAVLGPLASACVEPGDGSRVADLGHVFGGTEVACVYAKQAPATMAMVEEAEVVEGCRAIGVDLGMPGPSDLGLVEDIVVDRAFHEARQREALELTTHGELSAAGLGAPGDVLAVLTAAALARASGIEPAEFAAAMGTLRV